MDNAQEAPVTFDLLEEGVLTDLANLTEDEQNEVQNVVSLLEEAEGDSLLDFEPPENARHNPIDCGELDRLAGKNQALNTGYQTKWAVEVLKGTICSLFMPKTV